MRILRHPAFALLTLTLLYLALMKAGGSNVRFAFRVPHEPATGLAYALRYSWAIRWGSFCEFCSALALGLFMQVAISRLRSAGIRTAGESIASLGAAATPLMLAGSALATWSLTRPGVAAAPGAVQALQSLGFDGGGPGFAVFFGMFVGGVSLSAALRKLIPGWLLWLGIVITAAAVCSSFTLLNFTAGYFIPAVRFLSIVWMLGLALTLRAHRALEHAE